MIEFSMSQNGQKSTKWAKMDKNGQKWIKMDKNGQKWTNPEMTIFN